jgi:16S rRNA (adenine1518-N6/adenine1519-N6)-dimethyltransferase
LIRPKKSLGQNFLVDARVARRIVQAVSAQSSDLIIEVGPGSGALTRGLVNDSGYVTAVEIDNRLVDALRRSLAAKNLSIIETDALKVDWVELIETAVESWSEAHNTHDKGPRVRVVANLPYYISTPIIENLLRLGPRLFDLTLMLQREVVDRMTSRPGTREYGYLTVLVQYYATATRLFDVAPSAFKPAPKVWSAVVHLNVHGQPPITVCEDQFFKLVSAAFAHRRKTISNNLKAAAHVLKIAQPVDTVLARAGIEARRRAETLSLEEFGELYKALQDTGTDNSATVFEQ